MQDASFLQRHGSNQKKALVKIVTPKTPFMTSAIPDQEALQQRQQLHPPASMPSSSPRSLYSRPLDAIYILWLAIHLLIIIFIDIVPFYPTFLQFPVLLQVQANYIADYKDPLVSNPPPWFLAFLWVEALYQLPICGLGIWGLWNGEILLLIRCSLFSGEILIGGV